MGPHLFTLLIAGLTAALAGTVVAQADTVIHTVYAAAALSKGGLQLEWKQTPEGWDSINSLRHHEFQGECSTLLSHQQMFALREMANRGILSAAQVQEYAELGTNFAPRQISFFEHSVGGQTRASLWSVSGQDYDGAIQSRTLPWMLEPKWKALAETVDRKKYPFLWEWGRAAQTDDGDINTLLDFATQKAYRELKTLGGKVEDAYIMVHAISPAHTLSYLRRFPDIQFSKNAVRDGDSILMIPLTRVLGTHSLGKSSKLIGDVKKIIGDPRFTDEIIVDLIEAFRGTLWLEATWSGVKGPSPFPLLVQDFSYWGVNSVHAQLRFAGIPEVRSKAAIERLLSMPITKRLRTANRYIDASEPKGAARLAGEARAIEVTGLDPAQLAQDPLYLHRVLFGVAASTITQARAIFPGAPIKEIWHRLITSKTPIALSTRNPEVSAAIRKLRPDSTKQWVTQSADHAPKEFRDILGDDWGTTTDVHFFSFGRLLEMTMENPTLDPVFNTSHARLRRDRHQAEYSLMDPDLF